MNFKIFTSAQSFLEEFFILYPPEDLNFIQEQIELLESLNLFGNNNVVIVPDLSQPLNPNPSSQYISRYDPNFDFSILTPEIEGVSFLPFEVFKSLLSDPIEDSFDNFRELQDPDFDPDLDLIPPLAPSVSSLSFDSGLSSNDRITNDTTLIIRGTAENNASVLVFINGAVAGSTRADGNGNWAFDYTGTSLEDGDYDLAARAIDAFGNIGPLSSTFAFTIDTKIETPLVEGVSDDTGVSDSDGITSDRTLILRGKSEPDSVVEIFVDGVSKGLAVTDNEGNWVFDEGEDVLADGQYSVTVKAVDVAGNLSNESDPFSVTVDNVVEPPIFGRIFNDTGISNRDEVTNDSTLVFAGLAEPGSTVELFLARSESEDEFEDDGPDGPTRNREDFEGPIRGESIGIATANEEGIFIFDNRGVELPEGEYVLTGQATDLAGNISGLSKQFWFETDLTPPVEPRVARIFNDTGFSKKDGVTSDPEIVIAGLAEAHSRVHVFLDGNQIGTTKANGAGRWFLNHTRTSLEEGSYEITARSEDTAGNISDESDPYDIRIDTTAPNPPVVGRLLNDTGVSNRDEITSDSSLIFIGFAEPKTQVEVFIDGESIGSTRANSKGVWFFDNREADLPDGFYEVTATATDRAGNVSKVSETLGVTVDTEAPESPSLELVREDDFIFDDRLEDGPEGRDRDFPQNFFLFEDGPGPEDGVEYTSDNTLSFRGFGEAGTFVAIYLSQEQEGPRERPDFDLARIPDQEPREERLGVVRVKKNGTWNFSLDEPLEDGPYSISVEGIDLAGNVSERSSFLNVTVDTVPPEAPTIERIKKDTGRDNDDGITSDDTLLVIGRAEPRSLVEVLLDEGEEGARVIGFVQANEEGVWRFDYSENPLGDGDYHILASARDFAGNISDLSEPLEITVDTRAPETPTFQRIKKDTGRDNQDEITSDNTLLMIGEAEPESYVQIFLSDGEGVGKKIGTVEANDEGKWRFDHRDNPLEDGTYQISVRAVDIAGNKSLFSEPSQIVIDTVAPEVPSLELVREDNPIFDGPFEGKEQDFAQKPILNQEDRDFENRIEYTSDNTISLRGFAEPGSLVKLFLGKEKIAEIEVGDNGAWAYSLEEPLIDGPYDFSVKAIDIAGNASKASLPLNVIVDTVAPDAPVINGVNSDTGSSGSDGVTSDNTPTIYGTAEPGSLVEVFVGEGRLAGRAFADNSGNWALEYEGEVPARDGYYGVRAHAVDPAGNVSNLSDPFNVVIDTAAPDAPVIENITVDTGVSRGDGITSDNTLSINGRAEANSRVELFINNISVGTTMADGDGNWLFDYTGTTLADGEYSLLARATDQAGNESPDSAVKPLVIDTMGPGAPVIEAISQDTGIPDDAITSDNTIMISGTAEANSTVAVFVNGAPVGQTNTNNDGNWQFDYTKVTLADNAYNVTAQAIDRAGNFGPISNLFTVTIDTNPPAVPVINSFSEDSGQEGDGITADNGLIFDGVADPGSTIILFLNGEEIGRTKVDAERSWRFDYSEVGLQDGPYGLTALAEDIAGNQSEASEPINFVVDTVAPEAPVISGISIDSGSSASDGVTSDNTPAVNGQAEPGSKVEVFLNDESLGITQADLEGSWSLDYVGPPLEDGGYNLTAVATDAAGNASDTSRIFPLRIDTVSPQIPTVYVQQDDMIPDDRNNEEPLLNLFRVEEPNGDDRIPFLSDKTPTFAGMAEPGSTVVILVDGEEAGRAQSNQEGNWTFTFGEPLDELQIELNEGPFGFGEDLQIGLNEGPHDVKVFSIDLAGNQSPESASVGFVVDTIAPEAPLINGISMDTGSSDSDGITSDSTPTIRGMAEAGSRVEVFINGNSIGFTGADPEGSWSLSYQGPPLEDGLHNVAAVARDRAGNTSDTSEDYPIQIDLAPPPAPNINSISADTGLDGKDGITSDNTLVIKGDAEIGATVEVFIDGQSIGTKKVGENGKWSLNYKKTTLEDGDYVLTASAVSLAGLEGPLSDEFLIKIDTVAPKAPGISGVNSDSGASASDGITSDNRPDLEGTAEPGSRVQIFQDGKSIGKVFADEDGNWQFGMRRLSDGNYTLTAEQKDLAGNKSLASDPFDLVIDTVAPKAPVITHISDDTGTMSVDHIVNGDFEGGNAGWTFDANGTEISFSASVYGLSNQGHGSVVSEMIAELPVTLSQNLTNLIFGESYTLSFDIALRNNPEVGDGLRVVWNGVTVFDETGESALIQDWQTFNLNLVAGSGDGSDTIEFIGLSGDSGDSRGAVLDNVSFVGLALDTIDGVTSDNTLFINGTAEANSEVEVFFDGISVGMTQADERGNWRFDNSENLLENGSYEVTAQAKDAADNASPVSEIYNVTVTTPPQEELLLQTGFGENNTFEWDSAALLDLNSLANGEHGHYRTLDLSVNEGSVSLNLNEVLDVSGPNNYLVIEGDADNAVEIEDEQGWSLVQTGFNEGGNVYNVYTNGDATLQIDQSIVIQSIVPV